MECLLCTMWARMPYAKRHTTPTTSQETEGALIVGYWLASRQRSAPRVCERHLTILHLLDDQEERRIEGEKAAQELARQQAEPPPPVVPFIQNTPVDQLPPHVQEQVGALQQRQQIIANGAAEELLKSHPKTPFQLGPGPLTNENSVTPPPPLPVEADPSAPYRTISKPVTVEGATISIGAPTPPSISEDSSTSETHAKPGTLEGALEAKLAPPVEGAKVIHPCPLCGKAVTTGDVHAC